MSEPVLRLLHLVHQYPPRFIGGTELYTQTLARYQASTSHSVSVFCPDPDSGEPSFAVSIEQGVRVWRAAIKPRSRNQVFLNSFHQEQLRKMFERTVEEERPEIIHIQHLMGIPMAVVERIKALKIPFVITLHDYWYLCANAQLLTNTEQEICSGPNASFTNCAACAFARAGWFSATWLAPCAAPLFQYRHHRLNKILDQASAIVAPTTFVQRTYAELGAPAKKIKIVRHGLELPQIDIERARTQRKNRSPRDSLQIGYIGGINWQKGIHVLIDALNMLPEDKVSLKIHGDLSSFPEYAAHLRQISRHPGVELAGSVSREDIWSTLAGFDLLVLPTLWYETSSLILDEAFAVHLPVVASQIGVMKEKISEGINGRLFPVGDAAALSQILADLIDRPDVLQQWQKGIPKVRTIAEHVRDVEAVYQEAIDAV